MVKSLKFLFGLLAVLAILVAVYVMFGKGVEGFENAKLVTYYFLPGCPHCQSFQKEWDLFEILAKKEGFETRTVDGSASEEPKAKGITGFPTVLVKDGEKEQEYNGARKASELLAFVKA